MNKVIFLFLGILGFGIGTKAQVSNTTDRPGQAISSRILKADNLQYATGVEFHNWKNTIGDDSKFASTLWDNVFRVGIKRGGEIGFGMQVLSSQSQIVDSIFLNRGLQRFSLKFRNNIFLNASRFKALAYEFDLGVPLLNEVSNNKYFSPKFTLSSEFYISDKINAVFNLGLLWDGVIAEQTYFHVVNINYGIDTRWSVFAEHYASVINGSYDGKWDAGLAYLQNGLCQIDLYGGYDSDSANQNQWFIGIGVSWLKSHPRDYLD